METRASYVIVGIFVLVLVATGFGFSSWLARVEFEEPRRYAILFAGSVTGLEVGSPVRLRGVPVGSVGDIRIDADNIERIRVVAELRPDTPVKTDTVASLGVQGITGVAFIQLEGGTSRSAPLVAREGQGLAVIASKPSGLEKVLTKAPQLFEEAVRLLGRLVRLFDERNLKAVGSSLENIRSMTDSLARQTTDLNRLMTEGRDTLVAMRRAADGLAALTGDIDAKTGSLADGATKVMADATATLGEVSGAAQSLSKVADRLEKLVDENRLPLRDFSNTGLYELSQFIAEARVLVVSLTRVSAQIERDPARFFFGDTQRGFKPR